MSVIIGVLVKMSSKFGLVFLVITSLALTACAQTGQALSSVPNPFAGSDKPTEVAGIGVNSFLWRASLETLDFMPLDSADPYGGVIITDWHSSNTAPNERFKATVYILDTRLRADGIKVSIFKQTKDENGNWVTSGVDPDTGIQIENSILSRARELRIRTLR